MNRSRSFVLLACTALILGAQQANPWQEFSPPDRSYTILLPAAPTEYTLNRDGVVAHTATSSDEINKIIFIVARFDLERPVQGPAESRRFLKGHVDGMLENSDGKQVDSTDLFLGNVPGKEVVIDGVNGKKMRTQVYVVDRKAFSLSVLADELEQLRSDSAQQFFASFRVLNLPPSPVADGSRSYRLGYLMGTLAVGGGMVAALVTGLLLLARSQRRNAVRVRRHRERDQSEID